MKNARKFIVLVAALFAVAACNKSKPDSAKERIQEPGNALTQVQSKSSEGTQSAEVFYATSNLRLRSEPDTGKDNRIAGVPQGGKVELLEIGKTDTIDGITARWFKVKAADGTIGWAFSGYLTDAAVPASAPQSASAGTYDYTKVQNGDLSDFVGTWAGGGDGAGKQLRANGTFYDGEIAGAVQRVENSPVASGGAVYMWNIRIPDEGGYGVLLFPAGVDVMFEGKIYPTDKTKVRMAMGHDFDPSRLYYQD